MRKKLLIIMLMMSMSLNLISCHRDIETKVSPEEEVTLGDHQEPELNSLSGNESNDDGAENVAAVDIYQAMENIELYGKTISLPCKFKDLGSEYTLELGVAHPTVPTMSYYPLHYNGEEIGGVGLRDSEVGEETDDKMIVYLELDIWWGADIDVNVLGISFNSTRDEIMEAFGTPLWPEEIDYSIRYGESHYQNIEFTAFKKSYPVTKMRFTYLDIDEGKEEND